MKPWLVAQIVSWLVTFALFGAAGADPVPLDTAVQLCVAEIRRAGEPRFEAYVSPDRQIHSWGSARAYFLFQKCMVEHDHPLGPEIKL